MKTCSACHALKPLDEFRNRADSPDGRHFWCRICHRAYEAAKLRAQGIPARPSFLERLWSNIQQCGHGEICLYCCWPWQGNRGFRGYGRLGIRHQTTFSVTRIMYEIWNARQVPEGIGVLHHCDFPPCVNPTHFFLGTDLDNTRDCIRKGRARKAIGEQASHAKLITGDVLAIRDAYAQGISARRLANRYDVSHNNILAIVRRKTWKHI